MSDPEDERRITVERRAVPGGHGSITLLGLNRVAKRNAADLRMLHELALAFGEADRDEDVRAIVVHAHGDHFSGGLDLADIGPRIVSPEGIDLLPEGGIDPWGVAGEPRSTPVVTAVQGTCLTLGVELVLASDISVAADSTRFGQIEVSRAILPFGGATLRFPAAVGWGNAMRWMLTGDLFDAAEAHRMGLVQEVVTHGTQLDRAVELAESIARQAPLAVAAVLANSRLAQHDPSAAAAALPTELSRLAATNDSRRGLEAFMNRTAPVFQGN